jgi:hypothetical protein
MIKLYNHRYELIAEYKNIWRLCLDKGLKAVTVYKYFKRNPTENAYTIFSGSRCAGKPKYIIMRGKK